MQNIRPRNHCPGVLVDVPRVAVLHHPPREYSTGHAMYQDRVHAWDDTGPIALEQVREPCVACFDQELGMSRPSSEYLEISAAKSGSMFSDRTREDGRVFQQSSDLARPS